MEKRSEEITKYFAKYGSDKKERLDIIRNLIHDNLLNINEKMWTKVPCFYIEEMMIVLRVFDDHINFIADTVIDHKEALKDYKITPTGMLQIFDDQELPVDTLKKIICASRI